jgi:hypothetical protein
LERIKYVPRASQETPIPERKTLDDLRELMLGKEHSQV